jgi:hypothetical protein
LRELGVVDFQWAAVCFVKERLTSPGFAKAKTLYKHASQFLARHLLTISSRSELFFDEYGASRSKFDRELQAYLMSRRVMSCTRRCRHAGSTSFSKMRRCSGQLRYFSVAFLYNS